VSTIALAAGIDARYLRNRSSVEAEEVGCGGKN
jgi:hypothetical protein